MGVLPFTNLSDSSDEYFSDGLTEDLMHALSLQSFYRVLSRNSTFSFKGKNVSTRLIAREIDATYLIQGSVRRAGGKIRVTAELIAPESGEQLWNGRYDRDIGDLFAMQDEITTSLSAAIAAEIYRAEAYAPPRAASKDLTAWDRFLKGLSHYYRQTKADYEALAAFRYSLRQFLSFSESAATSAGLTPRQYQALLAIKGFPGRDSATIGELAEQLQIAHHSAVGLVDRLGAQKLIIRVAGNEDRRQVYVTLTARGSELLDQLANAHKEELRRLGPQLHSIVFALNRQS